MALNIERSFICDPVSKHYVPETEHARNLQMEYCEEDWFDMEGYGCYYCKFRDVDAGLYITFYALGHKPTPYREYFPDIRIDGSRTPKNAMVLENKVGDFLAAIIDGGDLYFEDVFLPNIQEKIEEKYYKTRHEGSEDYHSTETECDKGVGDYWFRLNCYKSSDEKGESNFSLYIDKPDPIKRMKKDKEKSYAKARPATPAESLSAGIWSDCPGRGKII